MLFLLALGNSILLAQEPSIEGSRSVLDLAVRAAMALPDPKDRRAAVLEIAKQKALTPTDLDVEFAALRPVATDEPGVHRARFPLWAAGKIEDVALTWYVPKHFDSTKPAPLLMAFHWTGATGEQILPAWTNVADALGMLVVAPTEAGKNEGYSFSRRERDAAMSSLRWARLRFDVDESRIYFTGMSRGGHLSWDLALRRPEIAAAIAPMLGCPLAALTHEKNNMRFLENVVKLPIRDLQGSKDDPVVLDDLHLAFARLDALHASDAKLVEFPDLGHAFHFDSVDWKSFFGSAKRNPLPESIVLEAADPTEARCAWIEISRMSEEVALRPRFDVKASTWSALDKKGQRELVEATIKKQTAHLEALRDSPSHLRITSTGVAAIRLHIPGGLVDLSKPVAIDWNGKHLEKKLAPSCKEMLLEFIERLDRKGLSRVAIDVP